MSLGGRGAVITGGGRGIGAAVAAALAEAGATVVVAARTLRDVEDVAERLRGDGHQVFAQVCNVADPGAVQALMKYATEQLGRIDILVNNAGTASSDPLTRTTLEEWNRVMTVNATGSFLCMREVLPLMLEAGWGRVVNVASVAALEGAKYIAAYAASKHAVMGLTRVAAAEVEGKGVTVNAVCPGYVDTPMTDATVDRIMEMTGLSRADAGATILEHAGQARLITAEEVADTVLDLCEDRSASMNGRAIVLDGSEEGV